MQQGVPLAGGQVEIEEGVWDRAASALAAGAHLSSLPAAQALALEVLLVY